MREYGLATMPRSTAMPTPPASPPAAARRLLRPLIPLSSKLRRAGNRQQSSSAPCAPTPASPPKDAGSTPRSASSTKSPPKPYPQRTPHMTATPHKTPLNPKPPARTKSRVGHSKLSASRNGAQRRPLANSPSICAGPHNPSVRRLGRNFLYKSDGPNHRPLGGQSHLRRLSRRPPTFKSSCAKRLLLCRTVTLSAARCRPEHRRFRGRNRPLEPLKFLPRTRISISRKR